jgi:hypothetical protein
LIAGPNTGITNRFLSTATKVKRASTFIPRALIARRTGAISFAGDKIRVGVVQALTYRVARARWSRKQQETRADHECEQQIAYDYLFHGEISTS